MIHTVTIQANLQWALSRDPSTGKYVAVCEPLRLSMGGDDQAELAENINETLALLFASLVEDGEFEKFLRDHGWNASPMPNTTEVPIENIRFNVPWELIAERGKNGSARVRRQ